MRPSSIARSAPSRGEDLDAVLQAMGHGLMQKMLHGAMVELKTADADHSAHLSGTSARVFNLRAA